jgi:hypothetical protein
MKSAARARRRRDDGLDADADGPAQSPSDPPLLSLLQPIQ